MSFSERGGSDAANTPRSQKGQQPRYPLVLWSERLFAVRGRENQSPSITSAVTNLVPTIQFRHQISSAPFENTPIQPGISIAPESHLIWQVEDTVGRTIALTIAGLFLGTVMLGADHQRNAKKHKDSTRAIVSGDHGGDSAVAVSVSWGTHDIEIIRRHYAPRYRNLPPGLQKKYARTGQLPPGWQKKIAPFPASLERECAPLPAGYRRGVIDAQAVIHDSRGTIIDVVVLF